jgi:hypothetical protein
LYCFAPAEPSVEALQKRSATAGKSSFFCDLPVIILEEKAICDRNIA